VKVEASDNNFSDSQKDKVEGGCLPDWEVADLPAPPPYRFGRAFRNVLGPGVIALGGSIGSGEWLLGPAITAQYGGRLLWIATIAILLQVLINTEAIRYTLYTGEPVFSGFMRCKPGSRFWAFFYMGVDFFGVWPGWAATAATALAAVWLGYMPQEADQNTVRVLAYITFFAWGISTCLVERFTTLLKRLSFSW
jgi:Mn2+/Fe2+ NRAMP family transporter